MASEKQILRFAQNDNIGSFFNSLLDEDVEDYKMDRLTLFGLFAVTAMLVCYALESRSRWYILAFAFSCVLASIYGFLQGAWPFGLVEGVWALVAMRRWWTAARNSGEPTGKLSLD